MHFGGFSVQNCTCNQKNVTLSVTSCRELVEKVRWTAQVILILVSTVGGGGKLDNPRNLLES